MFRNEWLEPAAITVCLVVIVVSFVVWLGHAIDKEHTACNLKGGTFSYNYVHKRYVCNVHH
jgi:hypothetical protein